MAFGSLPQLNAASFVRRKAKHGNPVFSWSSLPWIDQEQVLKVLVCHYHLHGVGRVERDSQMLQLANVRLAGPKLIEELPHLLEMDLLEQRLGFRGFVCLVFRGFWMRNGFVSWTHAMGELAFCPPLKVDQEFGLGLPPSNLEGG